MKISPMSMTGAVVGAIATGAEAPQSMSQKVRALKMNTNATPGRVEEIPEVPPLTTTDVSIDPASETADATQPLSPQFAALAKQRRALQVKEREIADREKALQASSTSQADAVPVARLKSDPLGVMLEAGVTYEQLTEAVLANQNGYNPEIAALKEELKALKGEMTKTFTDKEAQSEQAALNQMMREATQISAQGEDFELVRETGSLPQVRQLIERTYKETGEVLDVREALKLVEEELIKDSLKIASLKKIQGQFTQAPPVAQPLQQQRQMRTLTNRDTASVPLSRKARALAAFAGTLKQ